MTTLTLTDDEQRMLYSFVNYIRLNDMDDEEMGLTEEEKNFIKKLLPLLYKENA